MKRKSCSEINPKMPGHDVPRHSSTDRSHHPHQTRPAVIRFFIKYRCFVVLIGCGLMVQLVLALVLALNSSTEQDNSNGPRIKGASAEYGHQPLTDLTTDYAQTVQSDNPSAGNQQSKSSPSSATLDLQTLSFTPECNITSKEAVSAIQRAKTQLCQEQLGKIACRIVDNSLYKKRLVRKCFNNDTSYGHHVGCFKDDKKKRILPDYFLLMKDNNSPQNCVDLCLQSGFQYAGVQYGIECFCGNTEPSSSLELPFSECNMRCPNSAEFTSTSSVSDSSSLWSLNFCGGYFSMNIYETGVFRGIDGKSEVINLDGFDTRNKFSLQEKKPVRIVFFLTLNGRALRQVFRLIKALFHQQHYFYIHVDSRQDYLYRELLILLHKIPNNVRFMANRRATIWGGASLLTVLLSGMEDLTSHAQEWNWDWDYVINLSESDFPLKTTAQLEYFLSQNNGKNFLKSHGRDVQKFIQKQGLDKTFDECEYRMWRMGDRKLPAGIMMDGGSDWIALHRDFVEYAVNSEDELVAGLKTVFKYTLLPAESFFHTLLRNSEMCGTFVDNNLHVTNWKRKLGCKCQYRNIVDWCGCSPNDFRLSDWNRLQLTEPRLLFFGRKFEAVVNQGIINQLESWLYPEKSENSYSTLDRFWLSLYHHHDLSPKPDDALVTLGRSLSRIASKAFLSKCFPSSDFENLDNSNSAASDVDSYKVDLIEIMAHNHDDKFEGILVKFQTSIVDKTGEELKLSLETWFKAETIIELGAVNPRSMEYQSKLKVLQVGGEYEQKEQIFRNFAGALGPFSEPTMSYSVFSNDSFNVTVIWLNPFNVIYSSTNVTITEGNTANFVKPSMKTPLTPGNWTVKIYTLDHFLLYRVQFLILPLEVYQGRFISSSEQRLVNLNSGAWKEENIVDDPSHSSQNLQQTIDDLVSKHYSIQDFCLEKRVNHLTLSRWKSLRGSGMYDGFPDSEVSNKFQMPNSMESTLETSLCSHTQWSSFYPDPKSTILGIDSKTGLLLP